MLLVAQRALLKLSDLLQHFDEGFTPYGRRRVASNREHSQDGCLRFHESLQSAGKVFPLNRSLIFLFL
jgi:hypothetical protein